MDNSGRYTLTKNGTMIPDAEGYWRKQEEVAALQAQLATAQKVKADYDRWLSGGVYFTTADYEKHVAEHRRQIEALQAQGEQP